MAGIPIKAVEGLIKAALMSADELAAKHGEDNMFVQVKRNSERLQSCDRHEFVGLAEGWGKLGRQKVRCTRCAGEMGLTDAALYLRGYAHGTGQDYAALMEALKPEPEADAAKP